MKRTCSLLLAAILAGTLATPAAAAATPAADDRLTQVTQAVKETLGLGDDYTSFYGELQEDSYRALWSLTMVSQTTSTQNLWERCRIFERDISAERMPAFLIINNTAIKGYTFR